MLCENDSKFLNTLTGKIGYVGIKAPVNENGKVVFQKIENRNYFLLGDNPVKKLKK